MGIFIAAFVFFLLCGCCVADDCTTTTFQLEKGTSPTRQSQACDANSPFIVNASACFFWGQRLALSRFYDTFPRDVFFPITPNIDNLDSDEYIIATRDQMDSGTNAIELFMECGLPFSVESGGHSNAGASIVLGKRLLEIRYMDYVDADLDEDVLYDDERWDGAQDVGTVTVGAGSTAVQTIFTNVSWYAMSDTSFIFNQIKASIANLYGHFFLVWIGWLNCCSFASWTNTFHWYFWTDPGGRIWFLDSFQWLTLWQNEIFVSLISVWYIWKWTFVLPLVLLIFLICCRTAIVPSTPEGKAVTVTSVSSLHEQLLNMCGLPDALFLHHSLLSRTTSLLTYTGHLVVAGEVILQ